MGVTNDPVNIQAAVAAEINVVLIITAVGDRDLGKGMTAHGWLHKSSEYRETHMSLNRLLVVLKGLCESACGERRRHVAQPSVPYS